MDRSRLDVLLKTEPPRAAACPEHGAYESRNVFRQVWTKCPQCEANARAVRDAEEAAERERMLENAHRARLDEARVPLRFVGRSFENFVADTPEKVRALTAVRDYAEQFPEHHKRGTGLILAGSPGTGKSHLCAALLQILLHRDVRYVTCLDMIRAVRETWRRDSEQSEREVLRYFASLDLLVIDEIGVQYGTDGEQTIIFEVLDRRYRDIRPTILITNQDKGGLVQFVGERTFDRLIETSRWIAFDWTSFRPTARRAAA